MHRVPLDLSSHVDSLSFRLRIFSFSFFLMRWRININGFPFDVTCNSNISLFYSNTPFHSYDTQMQTTKEKNETKESKPKTEMHTHTHFLFVRIDVDWIGKRMSITSALPTHSCTISVLIFLPLSPHNAWWNILMMGKNDEKKIWKRKIENLN